MRASDDGARAGEILTTFLRRSYHAVDGLWFVTTEEECGFERALELDQRVWEVMAKIQARKARELTGSKGNSPEELARCFSLKLTADGHDFEVSVTSGEVRYLVRSCPWLELMRKSDRRHLAAKVAQTICPTEGRTWCAEFGGQYEFAMPQMGCAGGGSCELRFTRSAGHEDGGAASRR
jgi:hypothetical protein